jgi:hypothetical protein
MKLKLVGMFCALSLVNAALLLGDDEDQGGQFKASLSGYQEIPTLSTASSGDVTVMLSADQKTLTVTLTFTKLEGVAQSAGLYFGAAATTGNIVAHICGAPKPACPATADGTVTTTIVAADVVAVTGQGIAAGDLAALIRAMENGVVYANVITSKYAFGEIRGQLDRGFGSSAGGNQGRGRH